MQPRTEYITGATTSKVSLWLRKSKPKRARPSSRWPGGCRAQLVNSLITDCCRLPAPRLLPAQHERAPARLPWKGKISQAVPHLPKEQDHYERKQSPTLQLRVLFRLPVHGWTLWMSVLVLKNLFLWTRNHWNCQKLVWIAYIFNIFWYFKHAVDFE